MTMTYSITLDLPTYVSYDTYDAMLNLRKHKFYNQILISFKYEPSIKSKVRRLLIFHLSEQDTMLVKMLCLNLTNPIVYDDYEKLKADINVKDVTLYDYSNLDSPKLISIEDLLKKVQ